MIGYVYLSTAVLALVSLVWISRLRPSVGLVLVAQLSLVGVGIQSFVSAREVSPSVFALFVLGVAGLFAGYIVVRYFSLRTSRSFSAQPMSGGVVWCIIGVAGIGTLYHFAVAGVPIFATDIERARFDFAGSGLFGLPGRMFLYGTKFAWVVASLNATALGRDWKRYPPWWAATGLTLGSALLSGFKGQVLTFVVLILVVHGFVSAGRGQRIGRLGAKYGWVLATGFAYFFYVATKYGTYARTGRGGIRLLGERLTGLAAEPAVLVLSWVSEGSRANILRSDLHYYLLKYAGGDVSSMFAFERQVSGSIYDINPASNAFAPPVTIGGPSELMFAVGPLVAVPLLVLIGAFCARLETPVQGTVLRNAVRACFLFALYTWAIRGGLIHALLNWGAVLALMTLLAVAVRIVSGRTPREST